MIDKLPATALDWRQKGIPADCEEISIDAIVDAGWEVLGEDLMQMCIRDRPSSVSSPRRPPRQSR